MITIEFQEDLELLKEEIETGESHWSDIFEFDALITFDYGDNGICEFETMHHFMTIDTITDGIVGLLLKREQSSYGGYGASYNKKLVFKVIDDYVFIEMHPQKGENIFAKTTPSVLAFDYLRVLKKYKKVLAAFQVDDIRQKELDLLD